MAQIDGEAVDAPAADDHEQRGTATAPKRPPGRPKGTPRTGGRAKGTPNKKNHVTRDYVIKEGAPLAFLCSVVRGKGFTAAAEPGGEKRVQVFPSLDQRLRAAEILSRKCLPDLKATELTGKDGSALMVSRIERIIVHPSEVIENDGTEDVYCPRKRE